MIVSIANYKYPFKKHSKSNSRSLMIPFNDFDLVGNITMIFIKSV